MMVPIKVINIYPFYTRTGMLNSPQYLEKKVKIPEFLLDEPEKVIKELIRGIKSNKLHIYPTPAASLMHIISRYFPNLLKGLNSLSASTFKKRYNK